MLPSATYAGTQCGLADAAGGGAWPAVTAASVPHQRLATTTRTPPPARGRTSGRFALLRHRTVLDHRETIVGRGLLQVGPPLGQFRIGFAGLGAQQQEIVRRTEPRMFEQTQRTATRTSFEPCLQHDQFAHRQRESLRQRDSLQLPSDHLVAGVEQSLRIVRQRSVRRVQRAQDGGPQQHGEEERRRHRFIVMHAIVRTFEAQLHQA